MERVLVFIFILSLSLGIQTLNPHGCGPMEPQQVPPLNATGNYELKQVSLVFRHGDRIMYQDALCWPNDQAVWNCTVMYTSHPNVDKKEVNTDSKFLFRRDYMEGRNYYKGNCQTGQLTDRGFFQELAVGQMYRKVYVDSGFLPPSFDPSITFLRSDEADRCVQSLQAIFMGLYPQDTFSSNSTPIFNINTMDSFYDNIVPNGNLCPLWAEYVNNATRSEEAIKRWITVTIPMLKQFSDVLGYNCTNWNAFEQIHDCLVVHSCHDQPIPSGVTQELYDSAMEEYGFYYQLGYSYPNYQLNAQSGIGYLLQEIVNDYILPAVNNQTYYKLALFSGHDTTLLPILTSFQLWDGHIWAHYASQMQFELYESLDDLGYYIRVCYNGKELIIPGCPDALCPWNTFYQIVSALFPLENQCTPSYY